MSTTAYQSLHVAYRGRESHAAANPWLGINALDALVTAYNALSVLRQQTMPGDVIQGHITDGGLRPNVIHAHAAGTFVVRAPTQARLEDLVVERLRTAPQSLTALMTGLNAVAGDWPTEGTEGALAPPIAGHLEDLIRRGAVERLDGSPPRFALAPEMARV